MSSGEVPKIVFASANLERAAYGFMSPQQIGEFAAEAGYDGVEYHTLHTVRYPSQKVATLDNLMGLHALFRTNGDSRHTNRIGGNKGIVPKAIDSPLGALLMSEMTASAGFIGDVECSLPATVPATLFPQLNIDRDTAMRFVANGNSYVPAVDLLFQPTDHVAYLRNARSLAGFEAVMFGEDPDGSLLPYTGYAYDTFHARRWYGRPEPGIVSDPSAQPKLLSRAVTIHISLDRKDLQKDEPHIDTTTELHDLLDGEPKGFLKDTLAIARELRLARHVTVELAAGGLKRAARHRGMSTQDGYRQIADVLRASL